VLTTNIYVNSSTLPGTGKGLLTYLRDIEPNEDIFLDYGPEWTEAWRSHVESFKTKKPKDASYISASDYICNTKMTVICTVTEEENNRYPDNLQTVCFYNVVKVDDDDEAEAEEGEQYDGSGPAVYTSWTDVCASFWISTK
jgi:hypothetical protein